MRTGHLTLLACLLYAVTQTCLAQPSFEQWDMRTAPPAQAGAETAPPVAWDSAVKAGEPGGPTASISKPKANSLVRAMVPVFGTADAPDFKSFRLEFGKGADPKEWILINASPEPQREDPYATGRTSWEKRVPKGNLGMWDTGLTEYAYAGTWKHNLLGVHTLRLTVEDKQGRKAEVRVTVDVARVIPNQLGGKSESEDGLVSVAVPPEAMSSSFPLISIRRTEEAKPQPGLMDVGGVYEWQPPGLEFTKPATLTFKYDPAKLQPDIELSKLGIYWLNQTDRRWFRLTSKADDKTFVVTAELKRAPMYRAFFGLFADVEPPEAPKLSDVPTRAQGRKLALKGKTDPHHTVIASVDGKEFKFTATHEGDFQGVVELREGENHVLLRAVDAADNASPTIGPYTIQMAYLHPRKVKAIKFLGPTAPARGDRLLIQLEGEDASADTADTTLATVSATKSDPKGFPVELVETGKDTGTYVGVIELSDKTSGLDQRLAIGKDGEDIVAVSVAAPDVRAT
ncbi:MAG: hypothetical protein FJ279_16130, partial [Planctomycetes bacterium]|nr:hypothetical protein [Planctomycetota bacterium]